MELRRQESRQKHPRKTPFSAVKSHLALFGVFCDGFTQLEIRGLATGEATLLLVSSSPVLWRRPQVPVFANGNGQVAAPQSPGVLKLFQSEVVRWLFKKGLLLHI